MIPEDFLHFDQITNDLAQSGFSVTDNFMSAAEIDKLLAVEYFKDRLSHFKKAGIGHSANVAINESVRGDYISWLDPTKAPVSILVYFERLTGLMTYLNQSLFLSLKDKELHLTSYPIGSFYKRHLDQFKQSDHRKISVILYLNHDWSTDQGGQLRIYLQGNEMDIFPLSGRLVCMRSDSIEHEVLPATRERLSITGWMLDKLIDVK